MVMMDGNIWEKKWKGKVKHWGYASKVIPNSENSKNPPSGGEDIICN